ncbi:MAG: hypothetical protein RLY78_783 [Pseudomonadota bacterium]
MTLGLDDLRRHAVARSLFAPTTLSRALARLGFVQADPIRAPARAQDLTLRHRVRGYRAGDLERRYGQLAVEEDFFVNYGFVRPDLQAWMHPRTPRSGWNAEQTRQADAVLDVVRDLGEAHPACVDAALAQGRVSSPFGGAVRASTRWLDSLHLRGQLRVVRRESGVRVYALREPWPPAADPQAALDGLLDAIVALYAPVPAASLVQLSALLRSGVPQWDGLRAAALARARARLARARVDGLDWYWPVGEDPRAARHRLDDAVRLLAPFDPVVWDRRRFERFWGWAYRFEAYTPPARRRLGYYALPLLWQGQVIGWGNAAVREGRLVVEPGYVAGQPPASAAFRAALDEEIERLRVFVGAQSACGGVGDAPAAGMDGPPAGAPSSAGGATAAR